jgi:hypothetical protein
MRSHVCDPAVAPPPTVRGGVNTARGAARNLHSTEPQGIPSPLSSLRQLLKNKEPASTMRLLPPSVHPEPLGATATKAGAP